MLVKQGKGQVVGIVVVSVGVRCHLAGGRGWVKIPPVVVIVLRSNNNASRCSSPSIVVLSTTHPPCDDIATAVITVSSCFPYLLSLRCPMPAFEAASNNIVAAAVIAATSSLPPPNNIRLAALLEREGCGRHALVLMGRWWHGGMTEVAGVPLYCWGGVGIVGE